MRTLTRYIGRDVLLVDAADLRRAARPVRVLRPDQRDARRRHAAATRSPPRCCTSRCTCRRALYELFPVAALIGTLFAISQLVANSEYTVMRASGASLLQVGWAVVRVGIPLAIATFLAGEYVAPPAERLAQTVRAAAMGDATGVVAQQFESGFWFKQDLTFVNIRTRARRHDARRRAHLRVRPRPAADARAQRRVRALRGQTAAGSSSSVQGHRDRPRHARRCHATPTVAVGHGAAAVDPDRLPGRAGAARAATRSTTTSACSAGNAQKTSRFEIAFWNKVFYPVAVLVMMMLALPFAQFQRRQGGVGFRIFAGTMLGLAFWLIGRLFSNLGVLNDWPPLFSAAFPLVVFIALAVAMLWWLERR